MAKKKAKVASKAAPKKRRKRRKPEEIIADLQTEIRRVRERMAARELKSSPAVRFSLSAVKSIDKAMNAAAEEGNSALRHALADARRALGNHLEAQKLKLPKANMPKGRRPKAE
jgi:uncharacterized membrane-anchored protein YjiN (DUF445 family)